MSDFALQIEHELQQAFPVKNEGALKRAASLISERIVDRATYAHDISEIRSDIRVLTETMKLGFKQIDKRFEQVDKRFEELVAQSDKRFEQVDKRFEELVAQSDKRFEQVDKRFEELVAQSDKRFEQVDKRFEMLIGQMDRRFDDVQRSLARHTTTVLWAGSLLFTLLAALMSVYEFVG